MNDNSEIKRAQEKLDAAVREFVETCKKHGDPMLNEEALFVGYIMTIEGTHWDENGHGKTSLGHVFDGGDMPIARAIGLAQLQLDRLRGVGDPDD